MCVCVLVRVSLAGGRQGQMRKCWAGEPSDFAHAAACCQLAAAPHLEELHDVGLCKLGREAAQLDIAAAQGRGECNGERQQWMHSGLGSGVALAFQATDIRGLRPYAADPRSPLLKRHLVLVDARSQDAGNACRRSDDMG